MPMDEELLTRLAQLEKQSADVQETLSRLERENAKKDQIIEDLNRVVGATVATKGADDIKILQQKITQLTAERAQLQTRVATLEATRIKPTPTQLLGSFRVAMDKLRASLEPRPGDRVAYSVSQFDVDLKAQVSVDKETESVRFILPEPGQEIPPDSLSQIRFAFQTVPLPEDKEAQFIEVPTLLQLSRDTALLALERVGLTATQSEELSNAVPGTVIAQTPDPGDEILSTEPVEIVIAKSPNATVPDLTGKTLDEAKAIINSSDLSLGDVSEQPSHSPVGTVIEQSLAVGSVVPRGSAVDLVLAVAGKVTVPDLTGMTKKDAIDVINSSSLSVGKVSEKPSNLPTGTVIEQSLVGGSVVSRGSAVDLVLAVAGMVTVPNLFRKKLDDGKQILKELSLVVGEVTYQAVNRDSDGLILEQEPKAGTQVPSGTAVALVVGEADVIRTPDLLRRQLADARRMIVKAGLTVGNVKNEQGQDARKGTVVSQDPQARSLQSAGVPVHLVVRSEGSGPVIPVI